MNAKAKLYVTAGFMGLVIVYGIFFLISEIREAQRAYLYPTFNFFNTYEQFFGLKFYGWSKLIIPIAIIAFGTFLFAFLIKRKNWARIVTNLLALIAVSFGFLFLIGGGLSWEPFGTIGLLVWGLGLLLLLLNIPVTKLFIGEKQPALLKLFGSQRIVTRAYALPAMGFLSALICAKFASTQFFPSNLWFVDFIVWAPGVIFSTSLWFGLKWAVDAKEFRSAWGWLVSSTIAYIAAYFIVWLWVWSLFDYLSNSIVPWLAIFFLAGSIGGGIMIWGFHKFALSLRHKRVLVFLAGFLGMVWPIWFFYFASGGIVPDLTMPNVVLFIVWQSVMAIALTFFAEKKV